jgi:hypothetical protein
MLVQFEHFSVPKTRCKSLDMEIPLADELKLHLFARREQILDGFSKTAGTWLMLLRQCKATGPDLIDLDNLEEEISEFKKWAEDGISSLVALATEESLVDKGVDGKPP